MEYDAVVIGAGVGGLSSALKLSQTKKVLLLERQPVLGGCATTFRRKGFTFESAMHCVNALSDDGGLRSRLKEFDLDKDLEFINLNNFCRVIYPEHDFILDFDRTHFIQFLNEKFPSEKKGLLKLFNNIDRFHRHFDSFCNSRLPFWSKLILSPFLYPEVIKKSGLTVEKLFNTYIADSKLKGILSDIWKFIGLPPNRLSALYFLVVMREYYCVKTCYVKGGYTRIFEAMAKKIKDNGSDILLNTTAERISIEKNKIKTVITDKGQCFNPRVVISNANPIETLTELIGNDVLKKEYRRKFRAYEKSVSVFQIYLGLDLPANKLGMDNFILSINESYDYEVSFKNSLEENYDNCFFEVVDHSQLDPSLAPEGKGTLSIMTFSSYDNWEGLTKDEYLAKKNDLAYKSIKHVEKYLPGLFEHIEVMEVATPKTIARYTLSPQGAIYGFAQTPRQSGIFRLSQKTKVQGLFLAGAWTSPGAGVDACFASGYDAAELALRYIR